MAVGNDDLARVLRELKDLMILDEGSPQAFRVRAYERGLDALAGLPGPATEMSEADLVAVKGIGKGIARTIREYIDTGTIPRLEELRAEFPPAFVELTRIPGLGPKTLKLLRAELGVENLDDLNAAIAAQRLRELPGLGAKTEEKVSKAIERLGMHGKDRRTPIAEALPIGRSIARRLAELANVEHVELCGRTSTSSSPPPIRRASPASSSASMSPPR
jgi:DNA polymerase (family 10)